MWVLKSSCGCGDQAAEVRAGEAGGPTRGSRSGSSRRHSSSRERHCSTTLAPRLAASALPVGAVLQPLFLCCLCAEGPAVHQGTSLGNAAAQGMVPLHLSSSWAAGLPM